MNAAVFVDFENLYLSLKNRYAASGLRTRELSLQILEGLLGRLRESGHPIVLGRSYAGFDTYPGVEVAHDLALMGLDPQYVLISHTGKNSADVQLALDVARVLFRRADIQMVVIVSGDRDFIPLARQVLEEGRDLRVVAIPDTTSGDLRARVGEDRFWNALQWIEAKLAPNDKPAPGEFTPGEAAAGTPGRLAGASGAGGTGAAGPFAGGAGRAVLGGPTGGRDAATAPGGAPAGRLPASPLAGQAAEENGRSASAGGEAGVAGIGAPASAPQSTAPGASPAILPGPVIVGKVPVTWQIGRAAAPEDQEENLQQCLDLLVRAQMRHSSPEIWLSPFLKGSMSQHFSNLVHPERRALINELRNRGVVRVEERENLYADHPYSVLVIDDNHPMAQAARARVARGTKSG
jgi:hypothetical protein